MTTYVDYSNEYQQLVGYTVERIIVDDDPDTLEDLGNPCIGILFSNGKKTKCAWVMCDPEGNGIGFLNII